MKSKNFRNYLKKLTYYRKVSQINAGSTKELWPQLKSLLSYNINVEGNPL